MIEKIIAWLNAIPVDKVYHFVGGIILFAIGQQVGYGLALAVLGAVTKEIYDYYHPNHTADVNDALATILGGCLGYALWIHLQL